MPTKRESALVAAVKIPNKAEDYITNPKLVRVFILVSISIRHHPQLGM
jgi:hypothetical protein